MDTIGDEDGSEIQMDSTKAHVVSSEVYGMLESIRKTGVILWSSKGRLHFKAPKGALSKDDIDWLRAHRDQIVDILDKSPSSTVARPSCTSVGRAPVSFSQLAHWRLYGLGARPAIRQIASATRLRGRLRPEVLGGSIREMVRRHSTLRTAIVMENGIPNQVIGEASGQELKTIDLMELSECSRELEVRRRIDQLILEPIDVTVGPLFGALLLRLRHDEHVLIMVMEHMVSDASSMGILLRETFFVYARMLRDREFVLPPITMQFADFAGEQRAAEASWVERYNACWSERLSGFDRLRFPADESCPDGSRFGCGTIPLMIGEELRDGILGWSRRRRTTLVMSVLTAYVALVLRWCDVSEALIRYQFDGRADSRTDNTIGYFASELYLRGRLRRQDSFDDLLNLMIEEYCIAYENADWSYIASQVPRPEFTRGPIFNWVPYGSTIDVSELNGSEDAIECAQVPFVHPMLDRLELDQEPGVLLYDSGKEVTGYVHFPRDRFSERSMQRFARNFTLFLRASIEQTGASVRRIPLA